MAGARRDRAKIAEGLIAWFEQRDGNPVTVEISRPPAGLSSETVLVDVHGASGTQSVVVRFPPTGDVTFPDYDLARQYQVQSALSDSVVPVAEQIALETDTSWLGSPFIVMAKVPGRTLTISPAYTVSGWLSEASAEVQKRVVQDFVRRMADVNTLDPSVVDDAGLGGGGPTLEGMLDYWERFLTWSTGGGPTTDLYLAALARLRAELPDAPPPALLWGDPELANAVYDDSSEIVALLDWEMAAAGPAEVDLAWFTTLHEDTVETSGGDLAGYPGRDAVIAIYEEALGRPITDFRWYELFGRVRSGSIFQRVTAMLEAGGVPNASAWADAAPQARTVARLLEEPLR